jgi:RimJ/RimL family protein N-acetyltransferase
VIRLRDVTPDDLDDLFAYHRDPEANHMAAFTAQDPDDRAAFLAWWRRLLADSSVITRAIVVDDDVVGSIVAWLDGGHRHVAYWLGRDHWGRGLATAALTMLLEAIDERPVRARVAHDNVGSLRVLAKCGFVVIAQERGFAHARGEDVDEYLLELA